MWTATVSNKELKDGTLYLTVDYTDGKNPFSEVYTTQDPSQEWLQGVITDKIARLQKISDFVTSLDNGTVEKSSLDFTVDPTPVVIQDTGVLNEVIVS